MIMIVILPFGCQGRNRRIPSMPDRIITARPPYPALLWMARYGGTLTLGVTGGLLAAAVAAWLLGWDWRWFAAAVLGACLLGLALRLLTEIVRLLVETLVPQ
jgi:hypothetical protein